MILKNDAASFYSSMLYCMTFMNFLTLLMYETGLD